MILIQVVLNQKLQLHGLLLTIFVLNVLSCFFSFKSKSKVKILCTILLLLLLFHYFFIVFLKIIHLFGYSAIQPQVCNKTQCVRSGTSIVELCWVFVQDIFSTVHTLGLFFMF